MLVEVGVQSLGLDRKTRSPVVVLREEGGERLLPIWIGPAEANAIAMHLGGVKFPRPLTHDLLVSAVDALGASLERIEISRVEAGVYHAKLFLSRPGGEICVDARPSDSIALALRTDATIFAADELLRRIEVDLDDAEAATPELIDEVDLGGGDASSPTPEALESYLRKLDPEDFGRFKP